ELHEKLLYDTFSAFEVIVTNPKEDKWGGLFHALRNSLEISKYVPSTSRAVTSMSRLDISTSDVDDAENGILTASLGMKGRAVGLLLLQMQECGHFGTHPIGRKESNENLDETVSQRK
nr:arginine--tRNA ligase, cytoplasmic [Tanacetum cinerariifolium]